MCSLIRGATNVNREQGPPAPGEFLELASSQMVQLNLLRQPLVKKCLRIFGMETSFQFTFSEKFYLCCLLLHLQVIYSQVHPPFALLFGHVSYTHLEHIIQGK